MTGAAGLEPLSRIAGRRPEAVNQHHGSIAILGVLMFLIASIYLEPKRLVSLRSFVTHLDELTFQLDQER